MSIKNYARRASQRNFKREKKKGKKRKEKAFVLGGDLGFVKVFGKNTTTDKWWRFLPKPVGLDLEKH